MNSILIIHQSAITAVRIADALRQMYPRHASRFAPVMIGGSLAGMGIEYAVWFSPNKYDHEWEKTQVSTRFMPSGGASITPEELTQILK